MVARIMQSRSEQRDSSVGKQRRQLTDKRATVAIIVEQALKLSEIIDSLPLLSWVCL
jgi:hypothetical protein